MKNGDRCNTTETKLEGVLILYYRKCTCIVCVHIIVCVHVYTLIQKFS